MTIFLIILSSVLFVYSLVLTILFVRYIKRLFQYDELFDLLQDDINVNLTNFDKLTSTPLLSNAPEIIRASKLMKTMRDRLYEYALRIEENALRGGAITPTSQDNRVIDGITGADATVLQRRNR